MSTPPKPDRSVARLLCLNAAAMRNGIVHAERGKLRRLFCLEGGRLVYATSNLLEEQMGEYLVRRKILTPSDRAAVVSQAAAENKKPAEVLRSWPGLDPRTLHETAEALARELLSSTLEWTDGTARFEAGMPRLDGEITVGLVPFDLIVAHCRRFPVSLDAVRMRLGPPDMRPGLTADAERILENVDLPADLRTLLPRCDGATPLPVLVDGDSNPGGILRALYVLVLTGVVEAVRPKVRVASDAPLDREECESRLASATAGDHYSVLGISRDASPESVRAAYYTIARRYHPDRFRSGALQDLLPRFEAFFALVTEAHNTLGDPAQRAEYDRSALHRPAEVQRMESAELARQNYLKGRALAAQKRFNDAVSFLENAVRQDDRRPEYRLELGLLLARNPRRRSAAEDHLMEAVRLAPTLAAAYRGLGEIYLRAGLKSAGTRLVREAARWDPDDPDIAALRAEVEAAAESPEEPGPLLRKRFSD